MPNSKTTAASGVLFLKAVILCDDFAFVGRIANTLQRIGRRADVNTQWTTVSAPLNALHHPEAAETILIDAADAHLVVIPAYRARSLSFSLRQWLQRWAAIRQIHSAALAAIDDSPNGALAKIVDVELELFAREHGLNLLADTASAPPIAPKISVRFSREREQPLTVDRLPREIGSYESFRAAGINE